MTRANLVDSTRFKFMSWVNALVDFKLLLSANSW